MTTTRWKQKRTRMKKTMTKKKMKVIEDRNDVDPIHEYKDEQFIPKSNAFFFHGGTEGLYASILDEQFIPKSNPFLFHGGIEGAPQVPCYFTFGDSLLDNGNNNDLNTTGKANYVPYVVDFPDGPTCGFTNGRNTADILGSRKNLTQVNLPHKHHRKSTNLFMEENDDDDVFNTLQFPIKSLSVQTLFK
ncbi:hypothetical protein RND71_002118 [Anisodus tanguticus]|uniref:Uncharacterized protein n=1 Tax=Anisodus tanguticus TaxID=243964 RepID=A0AAE1T3G5_9SOLA|nr:hypothetical protein RND71_002118 [Anisodus tanguticus]